MANKDPGDTRVLIVGAGLSGALLACELATVGYQVQLLEQRPDPRQAGYVGGRSINLAISCRAITALTRAGLAEQVLENAMRMPGRLIHAIDGTLNFQPYSMNPEDAINSVSRGDLNITLINAACQAGAQVLFEQRCIDADLDAPAAIVRDERSGQSRSVECDILIGADGAFSAVRNRMRHLDRFDDSQTYLEHGYKELTIEPIKGEQGWGRFAIEPEALHIWPRGGFMMIALPNCDGSFTCTLFWPFEGANSFAEIDSEERVLAHFQEHFPDVVELFPTLARDYETNPVGSLATIRCKPWHVGGKVVLVGDAAHGVVPFYGQGINCGFEDCRVLMEQLETHNHDWDKSFSVYTLERKDNADAIANLAVANFREMRDRVSDPNFQARKRVEQTMHRFDEKRFVPLYNLISFSNMPYAQALIKGERVITLAERIADRIGRDQCLKMSEQELAHFVEDLVTDPELSKGLELDSADHAGEEPAR